MTRESSESTSENNLPRSDVPRPEDFELLSDRCIRDTVSYLATKPCSSLDHLSTVVAGMDAAASNTAAFPADRDRVRLLLYHSILPRLNERGYLEFDHQEQTITNVDIPPEVVALVKQIHSSRGNSHDRHL